MVISVTLHLSDFNEAIPKCSFHTNELEQKVYIKGTLKI